MRHKEGLRITLVEESMLSSAGILKDAPGTERSHGLSAETVRLFSLVAGAGEGGLNRGRIPKELRANLKEHLLPLEMQSLVEWEKDNTGKDTYLVLTWKGQEALEASRQKPAGSSLAKRRRAAVHGS